MRPDLLEINSRIASGIKQLAADDRPREKLISKGVSALTDSELVAILINSGHKEKSAVEVAREILQLAQNNLNELGKISLGDLQQVKGIGEAKAIMIAAAMELGRRRAASEVLPKTVVRASEDVASYLKTMIKDFNYEVFGVVFLNRANKINHFEIISQGGMTGTVADPRIILKAALDNRATSIILCHNHPSGNLQPSHADIEITKKIKSAAGFLDVHVTDHLIVSEEGYFSFADNGIL